MDGYRWRGSCAGPGGGRPSGRAQLAVVFDVNVPIGLLAVVVGWLRLPNVPGHPVKPPDALGATLVTAGVALLSLGLVEGNTGAGDPHV